MPLTISDIKEANPIKLLRNMLIVALRPVNGSVINVPLDTLQVISGTVFTANLVAVN